MCIRDRRSIVTNLAPKMTPKWSPKRSRIENGRPSRNIGRHCPNTYFALSWELRFRCFFGVCKKVTKKRIKSDLFRNLVPNGLPNGGQKETEKWPKSDKNPKKKMAGIPSCFLIIFWTVFRQSTALTAESHQNDPKTTKKRPKFDEIFRIFGQSLDTSFHSKNSKKKMAGTPPCFLTILGANF